MTRALALTVAAALAATACMHDTTAPAPSVSIVSLVPAGGATDVDPGAPVVIAFSGPMGMGMEAYVALHQGDVTGPVVSGTWTWSPDRMMLTFTPAMPLDSATTYALHMGGGMHDSTGGSVDYQQCASQYDGQWVTATMMGGGMIGGGMMGGGMMGDSTMMGPGWSGGNGTYGMVFTFTTR